MRVLSLFDGMACGMISLKELDIDVEEYFAYEIDKYAIQVSSHNFPEIKHCGDVFQADFTQYEGIDAVIGGSPCTYWSTARVGPRETVAEGMGWELFCQYVRAVREAKPSFFVYENNDSMSDEIREAISCEFGFSPIFIDSERVSPQHRKRLYWVGVRTKSGKYRKANIPYPDDLKITFADIRDPKEWRVSVPPKSLYCAVMAIRQKPKKTPHSIPIKWYLPKTNTILTGAFSIPAGMVFDTAYGLPDAEKGIYEVKRGHMTVDGKTIKLRKNTVKDGVYHMRYLSVRECARLQTIPDWYDFSVISKTQAGRCIGNRWTINVIKHLISYAIKDKNGEIPPLPVITQLEDFGEIE